MENYKMYLELADSEVRAMESYSNFQMFLDETIESVMESAGSFKESMIKMKDHIVRFFKMIFNAIYRFFARMFGNAERLGHKKAISAIIKYATNTKVTVFHIIEITARHLSRGKLDDLSDVEKTTFPSIIKGLNEKIEDATEKIKDDVNKILNTYKDRHEYLVINKNDLNFIENFTEDCKGAIEKTLHMINGEDNNRALYIIKNELYKVLGTVSLITSTVMHLTSLAMLETKLKNPITIEVED